MARQRRGGSTATSGGAGRDGAAARRQSGEIVRFASLPTRRSSPTSRPEAATSARESSPTTRFSTTPSHQYQCTTTAPPLSIAATARHRGHRAFTAMTTKAPHPLVHAQISDKDVVTSIGDDGVVDIDSSVSLETTCYAMKELVSMGLVHIIGISNTICRAWLRSTARCWRSLSSGGVCSVVWW
ncbi:uncharacterized protein LOC110433455 isoform X1 [Sorghum bicolor]|uniref:Uncharacterized protein n=2 Tax=Sorghum bicolor TaxID=4558 RepID=A0A1B6Q4H8_SORBI|nr:uncharacterized protein LOC110433455 isoform X1 [Sorghum bicolor]KXG32836.1 hypothetical protein SORBI_3003G211500 [Sorghum bicolor]|eukprot:XP_021311300.1 uncharacterized protein LOC110433455 isoform X1 [Sorghum bicolor]